MGEVERKTTISISQTNYNRLNKLGNVTESFDDVVTRILDFYEDNIKAKAERLSS